MGKYDYIIEEMLREDDCLLLEAKDRIIDSLPSLDDSQKSRMKQFFAKRPSFESKFDWNRPDTITWDAFQGIAGGYEEPIDPDAVPEFSDKRDEGDGIVSYEVQDDQDGQRAVRRIVDTHWGTDANPWCLIARKGQDEQDEEFHEYMMEWWDLQSEDEQRNILLSLGLDEDDIESYRDDYGEIDLSSGLENDIENYYYKIYRGYEADDPSFVTAWHFWTEYSGLPKRIAFKDGRLIAFMATDGKNEEWWDRKDKSHPSVHDCA